MNEPSWKKIKLSLERPYKDDNGEHIPALLDITSEGEHVYEPKDDLTKRLGEKLRRIFVERGADFFDNSRLAWDNGTVVAKEGSTDDDDIRRISEGLYENQDSSTRVMTTEELFKMRMDILPQLYISLGEMSHAQELLALLLSPPMHPFTSEHSTTPAPLTATTVTKPPPIPSVQAFNAQLSIGGKDQALRKAADVFKSAAESMERGRLKGEKYWVDALKIRRGNWGLIPAPLPFGSATGKGADKTSKDFFVSFGLEESPSIFRRRAIGHMATYDTTPDALVFPHRQRTRLRVCLSSSDPGGCQYLMHKIDIADNNTLDGFLLTAQQEVVEQEIFSVLVKEASNLPTASARVSERLIVIDAAQGIELRFELVDNDILESSPWAGSTDIVTSGKCDLIHWTLHALLLRMHAHLKSQRLGSTGIMRIPSTTTMTPGPPPLLQPIIDLLQYQVFCERVKAEINKMVEALTNTGVTSTLRFDAVGESGKELLRLLDENSNRSIICGEAVLRIDGRHTLRLTFVSPSSLTAHLPQATLAIPSIPQLCQLLSNEIERCLLNLICDLGNEMCRRVDGTWFVDPVKSRSVGRWEGCVINFRIYFGEDFSIHCSAFRLDREGTRTATLIETYRPEHRSFLLSWVRETINTALPQP